MKRIVHVIPSLDRAGAEKQLLLLASGLPRDRFDVHVIALTRGGPLKCELEKAGIEVTVIGKRWRVDPLSFYRLRKQIARLQPDLVHTWMFAAGAYGRAAARWVGVPHLVASQRCVDRWKRPSHFAIERRLAAQTDRIVANCQAIREFDAAHGIPTEHYRIIANGIAPSPPSRIPRDRLLAEHDFPPETLLVGTVGRLWPQKRMKDMIWYAELMYLFRNHIRLLVIGDGPQRAMLERYVDLAEAEQYVRLLGHRDDVADILPHLDLFWLGSEYEGMPNSVMEAMAAGVPVVASDIPGVRELVVPGETGFVAPVGQRSEFCRQADLLVTDPQLRKRFGQAGKKRIGQHFPADKMVDQYTELYAEVLDGV